MPERNAFYRVFWDDAALAQLDEIWKASLDKEGIQNTAPDGPGYFLAGLRPWACGWHESTSATISLTRAIFLTDNQPSQGLVCSADANNKHQSDVDAKEC
jgi:hypothetical protein